MMISGILMLPCNSACAISRSISVGKYSRISCGVTERAASAAADTRVEDCRRLEVSSSSSSFLGGFSSFRGIAMLDLRSEKLDFVEGAVFSEAEFYGATVARAIAELEDRFGAKTRGRVGFHEDGSLVGVDEFVPRGAAGVLCEALRDVFGLPDVNLGAVGVSENV